VAVNRLDPGPDAVLISGDLADTPTKGEYELLRELVEPLMAPLHVLTGNHDDPALVREHFSLAESPEGDYRYVTDVGSLRLVVCDSTVPGSDAGAFGAERLAWLESILDEAVDRPTIVAMHHPPIKIGIDALDEIRIAAADAGALGASLASRPQIRRVICGHVHRGAVGTVGQTSVFACPSSHLAAELEIEAGGSPEDLDLVHEPPAFGVHALLHEGELISHYQPI
jgi:3',5'-cyclic AMP phosphodiesterase CpdA